jgi:hypothetical protein
VGGRVSHGTSLLDLLSHINKLGMWDTDSPTKLVCAYVFFRSKMFIDHLYVRTVQERVFMNVVVKHNKSKK